MCCCSCCSGGRTTGCCGGGTGGFGRRFFTKEERIKQLEEYIDDLEAELKAAREHLQSLTEGEDCCCH